MRFDPPDWFTSRVGEITVIPLRSSLVPYHRFTSDDSFTIVNVRAIVQFQKQHFKGTNINSRYDWKLDSMSMNTPFPNDPVPSSQSRSEFPKYKYSFPLR